MNFLKLYDAKEFIVKKNIRGYIENFYKHVYIQADVNDVHVFRIIEGLNEFYEEEEDSFLVEHDLISRYELPLNFGPMQVLDYDSMRLESYEVEEYCTLDDAIDSIVDGWYVEVL